MTPDDDLASMLATVRGEIGLHTLPVFDHAVARRIGEVAAAIAERERLPLVVAVFRGEQRVYQAAFEGTTPEHDDWIRRKRNTALRHDISSLEFVLRQRVSGRVPDWLDPVEFAVAGGAVPILVNGSTVGVVVASGLVDSIGADHDFVMRAIAGARDEVI